MARNSDKQSDPQDTGDFSSDELDTSRSGRSSSRRRRRRSHSKSKKKATKLLSIVAAGLFCLTLVALGIFLGLSFNSDNDNAAEYRKALKARELARQTWLDECNAAGHSEWTCNRFDRVHFEKAKHLDEFRCDAGDEVSYRCTYRLGTAEIAVVLPESFLVNGVYAAPRKKASARITHSSHEDDYFIGISAAGHIEFREKNRALPILIVNPATGSMNTLNPDVTPDLKSQDD